MKVSLLRDLAPFEALIAEQVKNPTPQRQRDPCPLEPESDPGRGEDE